MRERKSNEVEKFKRRIIRVVARHISENNDDEELEKMWEMMKKETRCDCKLLWERMRTLTIKKIKRLLPADDRNDGITSIARLSATDWLLFDLVLVHEKIDVIGEDLWVVSGEEPEVLYELFFLVQEYDVEELTGPNLVDAWLNLTREYNEGDRKCSPMMLQRRWYQMKKCARERFYKFWGSYRGNVNYLERAKSFKPTNLQVDIVRKYRNIIVSKFPDWNELIADGKVIMAQEFDERIAASRKKPETQDDQPEIELVEQNVETISLEGDSDSENTKDDDDDNGRERHSQEKNDTSKLPVKIKKELAEPIDIDETDSLKLLESINIPCETPFGQIEHESPPAVNENNATEKDPTSLYDIPKDNLENEADDDAYMDEPIPCDDDVIEDEDFDQSKNKKANNENLEVFKSKSPEESPVQVSENTKSGNLVTVDRKTIIGVSNEATENSESIEMSNSNALLVHDNVEINGIANNSAITREVESTTNCALNALEEPTTEEVLPKITNVTSVAVSTSIKPEVVVDQILAEKANKLKLSFFQNKDFLDNFEELPSDIQFVDDGIMIDDDEDDVKVKVEIKMEDEKVTDTNYENETGNVDMKLLLFPTVYTKKLDHMDVFKFLEYDQIRDKRIIDCAFIESKPVEVKAVKKEENIKEEPKEEIYAVHADNDLTTFSDEDSVDYQKHRINLSSWLLQKPRVTNYNPIQLCKNPDFNTRLKRLTSGFLSYERNRHYLKQCQPLTIDLHKTFETKLIDKTLYLKGEYKQAIPHIPEPYSEAPLALTPLISSYETCAGKISNTYNKNNVDQVNDLPNTCSQLPTSILQPVSSQRSKVVNLPDINEVRRINQKLLCAEVAPIQSTGLSPPVTIVARSNSSDKEVEVVEVDHVIGNSSGKVGSQEDGQTLNVSNVNNQEDAISTSDIDIVQNPTTIPIVNNVDMTSIKINSKSVAKTVKLNTKKNKLINRLSRITTACSDRRGKTKKLVDKPVNKTVRLHRPSIPWVSKNYSCEEALLASDTVDKMLMLFTGEISCRKKKSNSNHKIIASAACAASSELEKETLEIVSMQTNSIPMAQPIVNKQKIDNPVQKKPKKRTKRKPILNPGQQNSDEVNGVLTYCCWARKKIVQKGINEDFHICETHCTCCCRYILAQILKRRHWKALKGKRDQQSVEPIILSDDDSDTGKTNLDTNSLINNASSLVPKSVNTDNINIQDISSISAPEDSNTLQMANISDLTQQNVLTTPVTQPPTIQSQLKLALAGTNLPIPETQLSQLQPKPGITETSLSVPISESVYSKSIVTSRLRTKPADRKKRQEILKTVYSYNQSSQDKLKTKHKGPELPKPSPIFIGKYKILLSSRPYYRTPEIPLEAPQILLPNGVHFVLLPNKELAVSFDPGVELDQNELQELQAIKNNIEKHIDTFSLFNQLTSNNVFDGEIENNTQEDNETSEKFENVTSGNQNIVSDLQLNDTNNLPNTNQDHNISDLSLDKINNTETNNLPDDKDENEQNSDKQEKVVGEVLKEVNPSTDTATSSRKTILSDLMEMSGISEEDAKIPETPTRNLLMTINPLPIDGIVQTPLPSPAIEQDLVVSNFIQSPLALATLASRPDLKIVTTYNDLKSAFNNKASFFKLDIITGEIGNVNVCIKKREQLSKPKNGIRNSEIVVDLTEETENDGKPSNTEKDDTGETFDIDAESVATPVKLFRAIHPSILRNDSKGLSVLKTFQDGTRSGSLLKRVDANKILKIVNVNRRKQQLKNPTRIEILDSDEDSQLEKNKIEGGKSHEKRQLNETVKDDTDDSDEEPLAKKAKRQSEIAAYNVKSTNNDESNENDKSQSDENMTLLEMPTDMLIDQELDEQHQPCENESEEDCILGV
ncbi:uncharacterized protein LOC119836925 isoform X2 [Zerene cesonia]|nr:uncharacterized protein LOC119836925 isoform X2 [Zerene cesonia]